MRNAFLLVCMAASAAILAQTGPGGVGNGTTNKIWLKADDGIIDPTASARIGYWQDQSGNNFNATQNLASNQPSFQLNGLNGLPFIHFDRTAAIQYLDLTSTSVGPLMSNSNTIFIVGKVNTGGADNSTNAYQSLLIIPGYHSGLTVSGYPQTTTAFMTNWLGGAIPGKPTNALANSTSLSQGTWNLFTRRMTENSSATIESGFLNGALISSSTNTLQMTNYNVNTMRIGTALTSGANTWALNGDISEVIVYNTSLNEAQRILVDNYLASKYNQPVANDKYSYDAVNEFPYQVAGIGREDATNLNSSCSSGILNIANASSLDNGEYALLGHNNLPLALSNIDAPAGLKRLDRVWKVDLTGDPGTVSVSFNVNNFSLSAGQSFTLLVDTDGQFSNATTYTGSVSNGEFTVNTPVALTDGAYMTLGYYQAGPSAPVSMSYEPNKIMLIYGSPYSTALPVVTDGGSTASFSLVNPPAGVTINSSTGALSIDSTLPLSVDTHAVSVTATNAYGSSIFNGIYTFIIQPYAVTQFSYPPVTVSLGNIIEPTLPNLPGNSFQYTLTSGSLNGLNLNSSTGAISGALQSEGTISATIQATAVTSNTTGGPVTVSVNFTALGATGPGGVGSSMSNKIWLDANYLTGLGNTARVATFTDRSGNGWNAVQTTANRKPTYFTNQLNGKPVIRFDRSGTIQCMDLTASGVNASMSNSNTWLVVGKANTGAFDNNTNAYQSLVAVPGYHSTIAFSGYPTTTGAFIINYVGGTFPGSPSSAYLNSGATLAQGSWNLLSRKVSELGLTTLTSFLNGAQMGIPATSTLPMTNYNSNLIRIGAAMVSGDFNWGLNGDIAEIIFYNTVINEAQRVIVENYISAKYGIVISNDKYSLNDATYTLDVEGIGTTDGSNSNKHSIASNAKGLKLMEVNSSLNAAGEFLFAGHGSTTNALINTDLPVSVQQRWQRVWYLEKTGSIEAKISFDISDAGLTPPTNLSSEFNYYQLLYRSSTTGLFTVIPILPALENGDQLSFGLTDAQLANGYYTLGYSQGIVWTGAQSQDWNQAGNWSLNRIPGVADQVIVNACATCPRLGNSVNVAALQLNDGSKIFIEGYTLSVSAATFMNTATVESTQGKVQSADFAEIRNSIFKGEVTLEKTGGSVNTCYGGNTFSIALKVVNSGSSSWQVATQASNVIQTQ